MFKKSIKSQIMKVIKERLNEVQKVYDAELKALYTQKKEAKIQVLNDMQERLDSIIRTHKMSKSGLVEKHVSGFLSKIL